MSDAARKLSNGLHLLSLPILLFQRAALGDIKADARGPDGFATLVEKGSADAADPVDGAIGPLGAIHDV